MSELKAVLFDLDGVLVDTHIMHYRSWQRLADELGLTFNEELGDEFRGMARDECLRVLYATFNNQPLPDEDTLKTLTDRKNGYYHEVLLQAVPEDLILPGAVELLKELNEAGIKVIVASGSKNANMVIDQAQIRDYIDDVVDRHDVDAPKPDPEVFLVAVQRAGTTVDCAVGVEDAVLGVDALRAAGIKAVGVGGFVEEADLLVPKIADLTIEMMSRLV
jgi:beta-phosphoglucomutase